jgi:hypothetical protein
MAAGSGRTRSREDADMTSKTEQVAVIPWTHAVHDIPEAGLEDAREATAGELAEVAKRLELLACTSLKAAYRISPIVDGRYQLKGRLEAGVTQACVVTLEPVDNRIEESFDVTFWPKDDIPAPSSGVVDPSDEPDPEPITAGQIEVGRIVFECLAAAIDPFPRKPGAKLDWHEPGETQAGAGKTDSPFGVLERLKPKG